MSQTVTFDHGLEFIECNHAQDNWFLQIECFDPHPPFFAPQKYRALYPSDYSGPQFDFPRYCPVSENEPPEAIEECRRNYAALVSMCDHSLGRVLDAMDKHNLWDDTMLIVTTDHGFMLGEHGWWAFVNQPFYNTAACKPLFIWDPRCRRAGERCEALVQTHDLPATLLQYFGLDRPRDMQGHALKETIASNLAVHEGALFGVFGGQVNCTDGRYVYMRAPVDDSSAPLYNYTLMPTHMRRRFSLEELHTIELAGPFSFTKDCQVMKMEARPFFRSQHEFGNLLFDLETDPEQASPIADPALEQRMITLLTTAMRENDAPAEQFVRLGLLL